MAWAHAINKESAGNQQAIAIVMATAVATFTCIYRKTNIYIYIYIRRPFQRGACWRPYATLHHTSTYRHIITMPPHIPIYLYTAIATYPPQSMAIFMSLVYIHISYDICLQI